MTKPNEVNLPRGFANIVRSNPTIMQILRYIMESNGKPVNLREYTTEHNLNPRQVGGWMLRIKNSGIVKQTRETSAGICGCQTYWYVTPYYTGTLADYLQRIDDDSE